MKINLYEVKSPATASVADICRQLKGKSLEDRVLSINGYPMKMERCDESSSDPKVVFADFCKHSHYGPGLSSKEKETTTFDMEEEQGFGDMVAMLATDDGKYAMVQFNHRGVRASAIAKYLSKHSQSAEVVFTPLLKGDLLHKLSSAMSVSWMETKFDFSGVRSMPDEFKGRATFTDIYNTMKSLDRDKAARIEIKVSKQRGNYEGMSGEQAHKFMESAVAMSEEGIVTSAKVLVTQEDDSEILDLIRAKEEIVINLEVDDNERMIPFDRRRYALAQAYIHWKNLGFLK